jgi:hypothetical protein
MSAKLGRVTPLVHGQVVFEKSVIHLKALKPANESEVKRAFLGYYAAYHLTPPSVQVKLWQPQDWEAQEFEEDPDDQGAADEDESESGAVEEEGGASRHSDGNGAATETAVAEDNHARTTEAAERFKKLQRVVDIYLNPATSKEDKAKIRQMMTKGTRETAFANDEHLALIFDEPGRKRDDAIGNALLKLAAEPSVSSGNPRDPKRFEQLARCISLDVWNDSGSAIGAIKRGPVEGGWLR